MYSNLFYRETPDNAVGLLLSGQTIFTPTPDKESMFAREADNALRKRFSPGHYVLHSEVTEILRFRISYFNDLTSSFLRQHLTPDVLHFLLSTFDSLHEIQEVNELLIGNALEWRNREGISLRRAVKFLCEQLLLKTRYREMKPGKLFPLEGVLCALRASHEIVKTSMALLDLKCIKDYKLKVTIPSADSGEEFFNVEPYKETIQTFVRAQQRLNVSQQYATLSSKPLIDRIDDQDKIIGEALERCFGFRYLQAIEFLDSVFDNDHFYVLERELITEHNLKFSMQTRSDEFESLLRQLTPLFPEMTKEQMILILQAFSICPDRIASESDRQEWNPKLEYRLYRRGILLVPFKGKTYIRFSRGMVRESLLRLFTDICFGQYPKEWDCTDLRVQLGTLVKENGAWFEQEVSAQFDKLGIPGFPQVTFLRLKKGTVKIAPGEIDQLIFSKKHNAVIVVECKMLKWATESSQWRNEVSQFITEDKGFVAKLRAKVQWVRDNIQLVCEAFEVKEVPIDYKTCIVSAAFISYHPLHSSCFIEDVPCVGLTDFVQDYQIEGDWPYAVSEI
ncbi:MAG: hypothetical protein U0103_13710 [Candidatus Obscuribacterales bacterium]